MRFREGPTVLGVNLDTYPVEFFDDAPHGEGSDLKLAQRYGVLKTDVLIASGGSRSLPGSH